MAAISCCSRLLHNITSYIAERAATRVTSRQSLLRKIETLCHITPIELDECDCTPRSLYQDPADVAAAFCKQNVVSGSSPEAVTRCFDNLWDLIRERLGVENVTDKDNGLDEHRRQRGRVPQLQERPAEVEPYPVDERPWLMVPLNVNGHDATLGIERESRPQDLARELCGNKELNLEGLSLDTCFSQVQY